MQGRFRIAKAVVLSVVACGAVEAAGTPIVGDAMTTWWPALNQPSFAIPVRIWMVVGLTYNLIMASILTLVLLEPPGRLRSRALALTAAVLVGNQLWSLVFFTARFYAGAFFALFPFAALVVFLALTLRQMQRRAAFWVLLPYLGWLGYDFAFFYAVWRLNPS